MLNLSFQLLKLFAEGVLPATTVQALAGAARSDGWGLDDDLASKLAGIGASGAHPSNCLRDLMRVAKKLSIAECTPEPYHVLVPAAKGKSRIVSVVLPHEQAQMAAQQYGSENFTCSQECWDNDHGVGKLLQTWSTLVGIDPVVVRDFVAIGLHADGVSYSSTQRVGQTKSAAVSAWNFVSAAADKYRGKRFLFFALSKSLLCDCGCEGFHTIDVLNGIFAWSMNAMASGVAPVRRHDGCPWTKFDKKHRLKGDLRCRGALLQVRGDWEWLVQAFRLRHYSADTFCYLCDASHVGDRTYLNLADNAPWRNTSITHERYLCECARQGAPPSKLFSSPGFRFEYISVDSMHCVDLGIFADAVGSLMFLEVSSKTLHRNYAEGIEWLNSQLSMFYSVQPKKLTTFHATLPAIKPSDGGYPSLKSKAAACRHLAPFIVYLANRHKAMRFQLEDGRLVQHSAEYGELVVEMANYFAGYHASCEAEPFSPVRCRDQMLGFLSTYNKLRLLFRRGLPEAEHASQVFGVRPKFHLSDHLVREKIFLYGSPRLFWCYGDEDFVGLVKRIAIQTRHPRTMELRLLAKYRLFAALHAWSLSNLER